MLRALSAPLRRGVGVVPSVSKLFTRQLSYPAHTVLGLPALSPTMTSGNVAKYLVSVGDEIQAGDRIAEIETDKATVDFDVQPPCQKHGSANGRRVASAERGGSLLPPHPLCMDRARRWSTAASWRRS